ncbi:MAG: signal peptidase I [Planctomycetota bacterium]
MTRERDFFFQSSSESTQHPFLNAGSDDSLPTPFTAQVMAQQLVVQSEMSGEEAPKKKSRGAALLVETATVLVLGVLLALGLHVFVTQVYAISGQSMEPTLHNGERVVIHKLSPSLVSIDRGDMIIFESKNDERKNLIKRVIALPGDEIEIDNGVVYLNGQPLDEEYARQELGRFSTHVSRRVVPDGHLFVLGDNRPASQDSRHFGVVPIDSVKGEVFLRLWPLDMISTFP